MDEEVHLTQEDLELDAYVRRWLIETQPPRAAYLPRALGFRVRNKVVRTKPLWKPTTRVRRSTQRAVQETKKQRPLKPPKLPESPKERRLKYAEQTMANILGEEGVKYRAQVLIFRFTVDFLVWPNTVIEVDGPSHSSKRGREKDTVRDYLLQSLGFNIVRILYRDLFPPLPRRYRDRHPITGNSGPLGIRPTLPT